MTDQGPVQPEEPVQPQEPAQPIEPPIPPPEPFQTDPGITDDDKLWALLSYILSPIVPIILLLMDDKKSRPFIKYHAAQALAWGVIEVILGVLVVTSCLVALTFIAAIYWGIKAFQGEYVTIPVVTDFLRKQGWV